MCEHLQRDVRGRDNGNILSVSGSNRIYGQLDFFFFFLDTATNSTVGDLANITTVSAGNKTDGLISAA